MDYPYIFNYIRNHSDQRVGQATFNACADLHPYEAETIRDTPADCFYDDEKVKLFLAALHTKLAATTL